ncbi:uncharacterized protein LOC126803552 [Argentina anserina]|uniref:uncharacterized protein LOC126803552 n=1 Tax=Argentina anserina TaxID=57926 RepID=UPI0021768635|nr:uncharacterized protein LOC126803552 [Potentilla anserina]
MERYFHKVPRTEEPSNPSSSMKKRKTNVDGESSKKTELEEILETLHSDRARRKRILDYDPNIRDQVRRHYFLKEYSIEKDALFCLSCYLFKPEYGDQGVGDTFTTKGYNNWKKKQGLKEHVGTVGSVHNQAILNCHALMNHKHHLESVISRQVKASKKNYYTLLNSSIDCVRFLLRVKAVVFDNTPGNLQLKSRDIQKDIINAAAVETLNAIMFDMGNAPFSILVDKAQDSSVKEHMEVVLRYVDNKGELIERFVGIEHVKSTDAWSLKLVIDELFSRNGLSISNLRGQGYDEASNMQGDGLKLIAMISEDETNADQRGEWNLLRNDRDIVNAMDLLKASNQQLQRMREEECEWDNFFHKVYSFCDKHGIKIPNMNDLFVAHGKSHRKAEKLTALHHYRVDVFYSVIDRQLSDLNDRFNEVNSELLICVSSLSPDDSFVAFDKQKLIRLGKFYPRDFSERDVISLEDNVDIYVNDM